MTSLLREMRAGDLDWASVVQPRLQALGEFVVSVLLGTHEVIYPGQTLKDFVGSSLP